MVLVEFQLKIFLFIVFVLNCVNFANGITNGTVTEAHEVPYQIFLVVDGIRGIRWCSGTLITKQYVLTSAYCIYGATDILARIGVYDRTKFEDTQMNLTGTEWVQHPDFTMDTFINDVGLIKLEAEVELTDAIQLAPLLSADQAHTNWEGKTGRFTGWGLPQCYDDYQSTQFLMEVFTPIINEAECHSYFNFTTNNQLCTSGKYFKGYCNGDQGGPLVIDGVQVGIIVGGDPVCQWDGGDWPTIHTNLGNYLSWIEENSDYVNY